LAKNRSRFSARRDSLTPTMTPDPQPDGLSPQKRRRLAAFLAALPPGAATKLFGALEKDRAAGGSGLPHGFLIDVLRRELVAGRRAFPSRPPTAERLFFTPFEDFLVAARSGERRRARIPRASLLKIWALLRADPAAASAARAAANLDAALAEGGAAGVAAAEEALFNAAGQSALRLTARAEADAEYRDDLAARLGGEDALADFFEIARLLAAVHHLKALQAAFPRPVGALGEESLYELRRLYAAAHVETPAAAPYLLYALMGRMDRPWRALRAHYHLKAARDPELAAAGEETGVVLEALIGDLDAALRLLERDGEEEFDAADAALHLRHFADLAEGIFAEALRAGDRATMTRIEAARDVAAGALDRFAEQSLAHLRRAMPVRQAGASSRLMALRPDFHRPLPPRAGSAARAAAAFLSGAPGLAERLDRAGAADAILTDALEEARRYAGDLVLEIRAAEGEDRLAARRLMEHVLDIAGPILPADEIALLRERAHAAAMTA
jgi:hypothetical protein